MTTSNEREEFERLFVRNYAKGFDLVIGEDGDYVRAIEHYSYLAFRFAWQYQQKRIDGLECSLQTWIDFSKKWESLCKEKDVEIESLQAKLNVAVNALEKTLANTYALSPKSDFIKESLAEINRIGE
jgi:hypothetical protein